MRLLFILLTLTSIFPFFESIKAALIDHSFDEKGVREAVVWSTKGGDDGRVIWVTTLDVDGPGSITEAINAEGPRIIKFKVAGEIRISDARKNKIWIGWPKRSQSRRNPGGEKNYDSLHSFLTIDGASAPDPGITFTNGGFHVGYGAHDVIIRHIRIRHGEINGANGDGISIHAKKILIDHCTITGAVDEAIDFDDAEDVTVQWCIIGLGSKTGHPKNMDHSAGPFVANGSTRILLHHNLIAKNALRNPLLYGKYDEKYVNQAPPKSDVINNVIFKCVQGTIIGAGMRANIIGNIYVIQHPPAIYIVTKYAALPMVYIQNNISVPDIKTNLVRVQGTESQPELGSPLISSEPIDLITKKIEPASEALKLIISEVGARSWSRNELEMNLIAELKEASYPDTPIP